MSSTAPLLFEADEDLRAMRASLARHEAAAHALRERLHERLLRLMKEHGMLERRTRPDRRHPGRRWVDGTK